MDEIYLDYSTASPPFREAINEMVPFLTDKWGNPTQVHGKGDEIHRAIKKAYESIYHFLDAAEDDHFIMTSSGAEAINHVMWHIFMTVTLREGKNHYLTTTMDEAPSIMALHRLKEAGCTHEMISVGKGGLLTKDQLVEALNPRTALLSLSLANGLTGVIQPLEEIATLCQERGIFFHVDVTHALGRIPFSFRSCPADFVTFEGSALHAPQGTGGLLRKAKHSLLPFISGGHDQGGERAGPLNVAGLVALGFVATKLKETRDLLCFQGPHLIGAFEEGLHSFFPEAYFLFQEYERLPHVVCSAFPGISGEALLYLSDKQKVFASFGGSQFQQLSTLLKNGGIDSETAESALSFSFSCLTTEKEAKEGGRRVGHEAKKLKGLVKHL